MTMVGRSLRFFMVSPLVSILTKFDTARLPCVSKFVNMMSCQIEQA